MEFCYSSSTGKTLGPGNISGSKVCWVGVFLPTKAYGADIIDLGRKLSSSWRTQRQLVHQVFPDLVPSPTLTSCYSPPPPSKPWSIFVQGCLSLAPLSAWPFISLSLTLTLTLGGLLLAQSIHQYQNLSKARAQDLPVWEPLSRSWPSASANQVLPFLQLHLGPVSWDFQTAGEPRPWSLFSRFFLPLEDRC